MSIKPDYWISDMAVNKEMITPFASGQVSKGAISSGISAYGYDMRLANEFQIFNSAIPPTQVIDPKNHVEQNFTRVIADTVTIPANSFLLGRSLEYFKVPREILCLCFGKSTYARCGVIVNVTPLEPEWEGYVTLEISNTTPLPAKIYANEGLAQVLFFEADEECEISYADKKGKYQKQQSIVLPKL